MNEYKITIPRAHAKQDAFIKSKAKRKVVVAGRRGGKTTGVSMLAAYAAMEGRRILEAAPTADQTGAFWDAVKGYFVEPIASRVVYKNETDRLLIMPNGGRIRCKTAFDADTLRGDYADLLILDEYEMMKPNAWDEVGAPMLLDNDGDAVFIGTPMRKNHFYKLYNIARANEGGRWGAWHFTSYDNPHLSREALDEIISDMTAEAYRQEILAEFLDNEGVVFRNIAACLNAPETSPEQHPRHRVVIGADWGKQADYTAFSAICADCGCEVEIDRSNKIDYAFQFERLKSLVEKWNASGILPERNAMGEPIIEQIQRAGLPIMLGPDGLPGFQTSATTKPKLIENLSLVFERQELQFFDDDIWTAEMEAYERKISAATGRSQYGAPEGMHDDTVIARALAAWAVGRSYALPELQPANKSKWTDHSAADDGSRWRRY